MEEEQNDIVFKWTSPPNMNSSEVCITALPHTNETPIIISGWLYKRRRKRTLFSPTWDKRWVVIQNGLISWRHSKTSEVSGSIELSSVEKIYKIKSLKKQKNSTSKTKKNDNLDRIFVVKSLKRTLCLMTKREERCDKWVRSIQLQLDLRSGGTFSGPKTEKNLRKSNGGDKYEVMIKSLDKSLQTLSGFDGKNSNSNHKLNSHWVSPSRVKQNDDNKKNHLSFESTRFHRTPDSIFGSFSDQNDNTLNDLLDISIKEQDSKIQNMVFV